MRVCEFTLKLVVVEVLLNSRMLGTAITENLCEWCTSQVAWTLVGGPLLQGFNSLLKFLSVNLYSSISRSLTQKEPWDLRRRTEICIKYSTFFRCSLGRCGNGGNSREQEELCWSLVPLPSEKKKVRKGKREGGRTGGREERWEEG